MAFVISDVCVSCGACAGQCPVGAISEGDGKFAIPIPASAAVPAQAHVLPVLFPRNKSSLQR